MNWWITLLLVVIVMLACWGVVERTGRKDAQRSGRFWRIAFTTAIRERDEARDLLAAENERAAREMTQRWYDRDSHERRGAAEARYIDDGGVWPT